MSDLRYLQLLSRKFPYNCGCQYRNNQFGSYTEPPEGTEHFLTDIHGEYEAFQHVLKNASGAVKRKVNEIFGHTLRESEKKEICTLIYYPEEKLQLIKEQEADHGRLVSDNIEPAGESLPECIFQIYTLKGTQGTSGRIFVYHSGIAA